MCIRTTCVAPFICNINDTFFKGMLTCNKSNWICYNYTMTFPNTSEMEVAKKYGYCVCLIVCNRYCSVYLWKRFLLKVKSVVSTKNRYVLLFVKGNGPFKTKPAVRGVQRTRTRQLQRKLLQEQRADENRRTVLKKKSRK